MYIIYKRIVLCYIFIYNKINIKPNDDRHAILLLLSSKLQHCVASALGAHASAYCTKSVVDRVHRHNARYAVFVSNRPPPCPERMCILFKSILNIQKVRRTL